jgi:hypothetical protein
MTNERVRADLALAFCTLIWGATFVVVKDALADVSVVVYIAVRFALAAAVMAVIFWRSIRRLTPRTAWAGAQIGVAMFGGYIFQTAGLKFTTPAKAAFITGSCVVLVPLLLAVSGRRRITGWIWAGAAHYLHWPPCRRSFRWRTCISASGDHSVAFGPSCSACRSRRLGAPPPRFQRSGHLCNSDHGDRVNRDRLLVPDLGAAAHLALAYGDSGELGTCVCRADVVALGAGAVRCTHTRRRGPDPRWHRSCGINGTCPCGARIAGAGSACARISHAGIFARNLSAGRRVI